jgi:hypothetical protein
MARRKLTYREGDWFAVPLQGGGYGLGLVARMNRRGAVLGYFFGPRRESVPTSADVLALSPSQAVLIAQFGDLSLLDGSWPILGRDEDWDRGKWPVPAFARIDEYAGKAWRVEYAEDDLSWIRDIATTPEQVRHLPNDAAYGDEAVAIELEMLLTR